MPKRTDYLARDDYFMWVAILSAQRSKDPSTQVGACIVNTDKRIIGIWYNGFPRWCHDDEFSWEKDDNNFLINRNTYVVHAEANAILNTWTNDMRWSTIYIKYFPCHECAKLIIQSGISHIVYLSDKKVHNESIQASKSMLTSANVTTKKYKPSKSNLIVNLRLEE